MDPDRLTTGLIQVSEDGNTLWTNRAAADFFGSNPETLAGKALSALSPPLMVILERAQRLGGTLSVTEAHVLDNGPVLDLFVEFHDDGCWFEMHPVTDRLRQRERTERADREQAITLLARSLAHELRNPLAGVRGAAQLIEQSHDEQAIARHARMIQREVDRITALIDHVAEDQPPRQQTLNLHQVLEHALELVQAESGGHLQVCRQFDPSIPEHCADEGRIHQLFLNLLRNAVQAGALNLTLCSRIEHDSAWVDPPARHAIRIDIDDDGEGVAEGLRERLFLPLVTGRDQGSGFGLAVVQQIARSHGGLVDYTALESGSRFTLRLPLAAHHEPEAGAPSQ